MFSSVKGAIGCGTLSCATAVETVREFITHVVPSQVTALTCEGPVGKFVCRMHTFSTLCTLHMRLQRELFNAAFADTHPPKGQHEWMTSKDDLDFIDFTEVCEEGF